jgi:phosphoenolpyruvate-protein kinase (PTS system EI component)
VEFMLKGTPASRGLACGRVRIVAHPGSGLAIERGVIIVADLPRTELTAALASAAGLVCAQGGARATLVTLAREFKLPVVLCLGNMLEQLIEGEWVWVDGTQGTLSSFDPRGQWRIQVREVERAPNPQVARAA